jgi:hypothetical protein
MAIEYVSLSAGRYCFGCRYSKVPGPFRQSQELVEGIFRYRTRSPLHELRAPEFPHRTLAYSQ